VQVSDFFVNRLGSHVVALCKGAHGSEIGVWNIESGKHQHLPGQKSFSVKGKTFVKSELLTAKRLLIFFRLSFLFLEFNY